MVGCFYRVELSFTRTIRIQRFAYIHILHFRKYLLLILPRQLCSHGYKWGKVLVGLPSYLA